MADKFESLREQAIFDYGREHERGRIIDALFVESMDPKYDHPSYKSYKIGLRMSIEIAKRLSFPDQEV